MTKKAAPAPNKGALDRFLDRIEVVGNKLPDPAMLFLICLVIVWVASALLAPVAWTEIDPRSNEPLRVQNQLTGPAWANFLATMVKTFVTFPPLGIVLVALLGVGVAEHTGFIGASLKAMLAVTSKKLLTPMVLLVAVVSHTAADAGYVLVIPLAAVVYAAAGRHPLVGIAAAFAGVAGGFSANFIPSGIDPLLQGFTQSAAQFLDPSRLVNPLCNWAFTSGSTLFIVLVGWFITDRIVEPRLMNVAIDAEGGDIPKFAPLEPAEKRGLGAGVLVMALGLIGLIAWVYPANSAMRAPDGQLTAFAAPVMQSIVPLVFLLFLFPGVVYGVVSGSVKTHKDIVAGMTKSMQSMGYYLVMAFFAALFTAAFASSNLGALLALKGAAALKSLGLPGGGIIIGIILLTAMVNLLIGSASAKWALLAPIFVPILMQLGYSPELTQAAYRVGDSTTNIITPLMPYFPLVVVFCRRYVKNTGIGTLASMMLPYSVTFLIGWTLFLLAWWGLGIPLGINAPYTYP